MPHKKISDFLDGLIEHFKGFVLALLVIVAVLGIIVGYKYYRYFQDDPDFCMSCHLMKEAYLEWQKGKHRDIVCQNCHHLSIKEQNQLLIAFVVKKPGPFSQSHGRERPWLGCKKCHLDSIARGSASSFGHGEHVFSMNIECKVCHGKSLHKFKADENSCLNCHKNKIIAHGIGMEASSCLKCHSF